MLNESFSVLMSLYINEKPEYLRMCLDSVLSQTVLPGEIVIVKDGQLNDELEDVLSEYIQRSPTLYTIVPLESNQGLGLALREGILHCKHELVARMDTDDVSRNDRFEKQLKEFEKDSQLDICGSHILEFESDISNIVSQRVVPLKDYDIKKYQKRRDGLNHVTVMFKKSSVLKAGNYQSCLLMEDTLLWANMFNSGAKAANIDDFLVYVRVGSDMFERRGGWDYFCKYKAGRKKVKQTGYIGCIDYWYTIMIQFLVCALPTFIRGWIFKKFLHR